MNLVTVPQKLAAKVYTASENGISVNGLNYHLEIWQGVIKKYNRMVSDLNNYEIRLTTVNGINEPLRALKLRHQSNYATYVHHKIYFETLGGNIHQPIGSVAELINRDYGSYDHWCTEWKSLGISSRAWVFLCYDYLQGRLFNYIGDAQYSGCMWDHICILAMDVTEHAYYLDFLNSRVNYIDAYIKSIDWEAVENRFQRSKKFIVPSLFNV